MRRTLALLVLSALLLTLCACGAAPATAAPAPTAEPAAVPDEPTVAPTAVPEPETTPATLRGGGLGAVYAILKAGDALTITGEEGDFYRVEAEGLRLLVEKRLVALAGSEAFESYTGYAVGDTPVYDDLYFDGEALQTLSVNVPVKVLLALGECLKVELEDGTVGYAPANKISGTRLQYSGGGGGGGGADGGDISLTGLPVFSRAPQVALLADGSVSFPTTGTVLADGTEAYLRFLARGDEVRVIEKTGDTATLLLDGQRVTVPAALLRLAGEAEHEAWEGYAQYSARVYDNYRLPGEGESLPTNTPVQVLEDFGDYLWIEWETGAGYAPAAAIGTAPIHPAANSGGGGGGAWTSPVL